MPQLSNQKRKMFILIDWRREISAAAGPYQGNRKNWLARAAHQSGTTFRQICSLYYGACKNPKVSVAGGILRAAELARKEAGSLATQIEIAAGTLNANNKDTNSEDVLLLLRAARALRDLDNA